MNPVRSLTANRAFQRGRETSLVPNYVVLGLLLLFSLGPLLIMLFNSVKSRAEAAASSSALRTVIDAPWRCKARYSSRKFCR